MTSFASGIRRTLVLATAGSSLAGLAVVAGVPGTAMASGTYCGSQNYSGYASWSDVKATNTTTPAQWDGAWSPFTKHAPGCVDLNLIYAALPDRYGGYLEHSNGNWYRCNAGYLSMPAKEYHDVALCTSVATGAQMAIDPYSLYNGDTQGYDYVIQVDA